MTDETMTDAVRPTEQDDDDQAATMAKMQDQIDDLTDTVASHQRIIEAMFASGQLPPDINR
jgi:hypothetical protein